MSTPKGTKPRLSCFNVSECVSWFPGSVTGAAVAGKCSLYIISAPCQVGLKPRAEESRRSPHPPGAPKIMCPNVSNRVQRAQAASTPNLPFKNQGRSAERKGPLKIYA